MLTIIIYGVVGLIFWIICAGLVYPSALRHIVDNCPYSSHNTSKFSRVGSSTFDVEDNIFHRPDARTHAALGPLLILFYAGKFFNGDSRIERSRKRQIDAAKHMKELARIRLEEAEYIEKALDSNTKSNPLSVRN